MPDMADAPPHPPPLPDVMDHLAPFGEMINNLIAVSYIPIFRLCIYVLIYVNDLY
jgi:hypothetical protein